MNSSVFINDNLTVKIDCSHRKSISINHSDTYLLRSSLREILGNFVLQRGSSIKSDRLIFDFCYG